MRLSEQTKNLLLLIGTMAGCLLLLELGLRLSWHNPYGEVLPARVVEIRLNAANLDAELNRSWLSPDRPTTRIRTDAQGYILPGRQHADAIATVAFLGGSTTECSYVAEDLRFPAMVSTVLLGRGYAVNTINAGRSGNTTQDAVNILLNHMAADPPDFVVLMEATNDAGVLASDPNYSSRLAAPVTLRSELRWTMQSASTMSWLLAFVRQRLTALENAAGEKVGQTAAPNKEQQLLPAAVENRYRARLEIFVAAARALGSEPILMTQPIAPYRNALTPEWTNDRQQARFNDVIRQAADKDGVVLIDLAANLDKLEEFSSSPVKYLYDGMHATDLTSSLYAGWIAKALVARLDARRSMTTLVAP